MARGRRRLVSVLFADLVGFTELGERLDPEDVEEWDVRALAGHVLWGTSMEAEALERAAARDTTPAAGDPPGDVGAATAASRLRAGRERLLTALDALLADVAEVGDADARAVPLQAAPVPLPVALDIFVMEAGAHTDDLRVALGGRSELAPEVAAATIRVLGPYLPLAAAAAERAPDGPVEARLVAPSGAPARPTTTGSR